MMNCKGIQTVDKNSGSARELLQASLLGDRYALDCMV